MSRYTSRTPPSHVQARFTLPGERARFGTAHEPGRRRLDDAMSLGYEFGALAAHQ